MTDGLIDDGQFTVKLAGQQITEAKNTRKLPDGAINMSVTDDGCQQRLFQEPAAADQRLGRRADLIDNDFSLTIDGADVVLPSGAKGRLAHGTMLARDILAVETMADFDLDIAAGAQPLIEYLDQPDLNLIRHTGLDTAKLQGDATDEGASGLPDDQAAAAGAHRGEGRRQAR